MNNPKNKLYCMSSMQKKYLYGFSDTSVSVCQPKQSFQGN